MSTTNAAPPIQRRQSVSRSNVSMKDWHERQLTIQDVEEFLDINKEQDDKEEYDTIHRKLQTRLDAYNGPNPFVHVLPFNWYEKLKIFLFVITGIIIVKILLFIIIVLFCYIGCLIKNCFCKKSRSRIFDLYLRAWVRFALFFIFGFYWIPVKHPNGKRLKKWPMLITPNHVSLIDAFILYYVTGAVFVAKKELRNIPMIGSMMEALGVVWVDRSTKKARKGVIDTIKKYAYNDNNPPLGIFPQGTCSNTATLTQFKCGAFIPGTTVLPTAIHYTNCFCDLALLGGLAINGIHTCCQFINFARIQFMEPYVPSEQEKNDAVKFANNVREIVADALGAEMTPHTFDDLLLAEFADKLARKKVTAGVNAIENAPFVIDDCYRKLQMKGKTVVKLGKIYIKYCDEEGRITMDTFCRVFHIKDKVLAQVLFELIMGERDYGPTNIVKIKIDTDNDVSPENVSPENEEMELKDDQDNKMGNSKFIMFDDFLVGVAICYQDEHIDDALLLFYSMMDREGDGYIIPKDCINFINLVEKDASTQFPYDIKKFCLTIFDIEEIENATKQLNYDQFCERVKFHKETNMIQAFLQFIIFTCVGIKMDQNMIVVSDAKTPKAQNK